MLTLEELVEYALNLAIVNLHCQEGISLSRLKTLSRNLDLLEFFKLRLPNYETTWKYSPSGVK